jgi:hypothetical protein
MAGAEKEKGHINVAKYASLMTGMMITNARLSHIQTR